MSRALNGLGPQSGYNSSSMYPNQQGRLAVQDPRNPNNIQRQQQNRSIAQQVQGEPKVGQFLAPKRTNKVALFDLILSPNRRSSAAPLLNSSGSSIGGNIGGISQHAIDRGGFSTVARQGILNDRLYLGGSGEVNGIASLTSSNMFASNFYDQQRR